MELVYQQLSVRMLLSRMCWVVVCAKSRQKDIDRYTKMHQPTTWNFELAKVSTLLPSWGKESLVKTNDCSLANEAQKLPVEKSANANKSSDNYKLWRQDICNLDWPMLDSCAPVETALAHQIAPSHKRCAAWNNWPCSTAHTQITCSTKWIAFK